MKHWHTSPPYVHASGKPARLGTTGCAQNSHHSLPSVWIRIGSYLRKPPCGVQGWSCKQCRLHAWWRLGCSLRETAVTLSVRETCSRIWCWYRDLSRGLDYWISAAPSILTLNCLLQLASEDYASTGLSWRRCSHIWKAGGRCCFSLGRGRPWHG